MSSSDFLGVVRQMTLPLLGLAVIIIATLNITAFVEHRGLMTIARAKLSRDIISTVAVVAFCLYVLIAIVYK